MAEYPDQLALYEGGVKVIYRPDGVSTFRLEGDPFEEEDLEERERRLTRRILGRIEPLRDAPLGADPEDRGVVGGPDVTPEMERELRALGY